MRMRRLKIWRLPIVTGATAFQFSGCDPTIRDTIFAGIQSATVGLITTFVNSIFLVIQPTTETATTTKAVIEKLIDNFC